MSDQSLENKINLMILKLSNKLLLSNPKKKKLKFELEMSKSNKKVEVQLKKMTIE